MSSKPKKARDAMYKWLANQLNMDYQKCHVKWFTRYQCRQAIRILRQKQIQLYGKDLVYERWKERMDQKEIEELAEDVSGNYWNYRWLKIEVETDEYDDNLEPTGNKEIEHYYELHEVYYDDNEKPFMWTQDSSCMQVENAIDLMEFIKRALDAAMKPVLLLANDEITELTEYIDGKEELTKWLENKK